MKWASKGITLLLSFLFFFPCIEGYIAVTQLGSLSFLLIFLLAITSIVLLTEDALLIFVLHTLCVFSTCFAYYRLSRFPSISWLAAFFRACIPAFNQSEAQGGATGAAAFLIFLILLCFLVIMVVLFQQWKIPFVLIVGYLLILTVLFKQSFFPEIILLLGAAGVYSLWTQAGMDLLTFWNRRSSLIAAFSLMLVLFLFSRVLSTTTSASRLLIENQYTDPIQKKLSSSGIYQVINNINNFDSQFASSGFAENSEKLGGPIMPNYEQVFSIIQDEPHYWRIQTKDKYTGEGWTQSSLTKDITLFSGSFSRSTLEKNVLSNENEELLEVTYTAPLDYIPLPYGAFNMTGAKPTKLTNGVSWSVTENYARLSQADANLEGLQLKFAYQKPSYDENTLKQAPAVNLAAKDHERYTQLPKNTPKRINELAQKLTEGKTTVYDQALAIENYLKNSGQYSYSMSAVPFTPRNTDYVDYFLFDSHVGYCDNFSSAMVVLLRSLDIPARWAKGFTSGDDITTQTNGKTVYTIRNSNAHSWPEVYFTDVGWVPFEPTTSFLNQESEEAQQEINKQSEAEKTQESNLHDNASDQTDSQHSTKPNVQKQNRLSNEKKADMRLFSFVSLLIVLAVAFSTVVYWKRIRWHLFILKLENRKVLYYKTTYLSLLNCLALNWPRLPDESLQEYSLKLGKLQPKLVKHFNELTEIYERLIYGNQPDFELTTASRRKFIKLAVQAKKTTELQHIFRKTKH